MANIGSHTLVTFLLVTALLHCCECQQGGLQKEPIVNVASIATDLAEFLYDCWNNFVRMMSTGIPNLKIPAFDPWYSKNIPFQFQDSDLKASASFNATNVESAGFSSVTIIQQELDSLNYYMNLSRLTIRGKYDVTGNYHYFFPVAGYGSFVIYLNDVIGRMNTTVYPNPGKSNLSLVSVVLDSFSYSTFSPEFENLSGFGADISNRNRFAIALSKTLWPIIDEQIRTQLSVSLTEYFNNQLQQMNGYSDTFIIVKAKH